MTTKLFQISQMVVPNWFGVGIPDNVSDFSKPNIFFHPIPGQDGYVDGDYPTKTGKWPNLFYYMELLGFQLDGAIKEFGAPANQIVIMPFLTSGRADTGIFPANWLGIVTDILTDVSRMLGAGDSTVEISEVVVSSFSVGYVYSENFRATAAGLKPLLRQVGIRRVSQERFDEPRLDRRCHRDQVRPGQRARIIHLPLSRWTDYPNPPPILSMPIRP